MPIRSRKVRKPSVLDVTPGPGYSLGFGSATRYIPDAQSTAVATQVRFPSSSGSAAESANTVNIPVTLSAAAAGEVTVEYFINGGTGLGRGIDYDLPAGMLTFLPGETSKNIAVAIIDDTLPESSETIVIALGNPYNGRLGISSHTLTITDNDTLPGATVGFAGATGSGLESQSPAPLAVALSRALAAPVTVSYAITGGTATAGDDYVIPAGTLTFAAGETVRVIPNTIIDDANVEPNETVILTLSSPVGANLNSNSVFTHTITDNDSSTVTVVATDADAAEPGDDTGLFTLTRTGSTTAALTVNFTIGGTATSGADYSNLPTTVVIPAGSGTATLLVTAVDDTVTEPTETVSLTLAPGVYTIGAADNATVSIGDRQRSIYGGWSESPFAKPFTDTSPGSDPDGDSLINLLEFAFGTDPTASGSVGLTFVMGGNVTAAGVPILMNMAPTAQAPDMRAVFVRRKDHVAAGLTYTVVFSADLGMWTASSAIPEVLTDMSSGSGIEVVSVPFPAMVPVAGGGTEIPPRFMRILISEN